MNWDAIFEYALGLCSKATIIGRGWFVLEGLVLPPVQNVEVQEMRYLGKRFFVAVPKRN